MTSATLKGVADQSHMSIRTVSKVINDYKHVSEKMRQRVQDASDALDYRPDLVARTLCTGRTGVLALAVPEVNVPYFQRTRP